MLHKTIMASLPLQILKEDDQFVAYCPALDLSTCGVTINEAKKMFIEMLDTFFEELSRMGTTDEVLSQLGWRKVTKPKMHWEPPKREFITEMSQEVAVPCPA